MGELRKRNKLDGMMIEPKSVVLMNQWSLLPSEPTFGRSLKSEHFLCREKGLSENSLLDSVP